DRSRNRRASGHCLFSDMTQRPTTPAGSSSRHARTVGSVTSTLPGLIRGAGHSTFVASRVALVGGVSPRPPSPLRPRGHTFGTGAIQEPRSGPTPAARVNTTGGAGGSRVNRRGGRLPAPPRRAAADGARRPALPIAHAAP